MGFDALGATIVGNSGKMISNMRSFLGHNLSNLRWGMVVGGDQTAMDHGTFFVPRLSSFRNSAYLTEGKGLQLRRKTSFPKIFPPRRNRRLADRHRKHTLTRMDSKTRVSADRGSPSLSLSLTVRP